MIGGKTAAAAADAAAAATAAGAEITSLFLRCFRVDGVEVAA